jgi:hypothetical protein
MSRYYGRSFRVIIAALVILFLILIAANAVVLVKIANTLDRPSGKRQTRPSLPCPAIPTRLILEDPACAQKLLEVMNVTDVRIRAGGTALPRVGNTSPNERPCVPGAAVEW